MRTTASGGIVGITGNIAIFRNGTSHFRFLPRFLPSSGSPCRSGGIRRIPAHRFEFDCVIVCRGSHIRYRPDWSRRGQAKLCQAVWCSREEQPLVTGWRCCLANGTWLCCCCCRGQSYKQPVSFVSQLLLPILLLRRSLRYGFSSNGGSGCDDCVF